MEAGEAGVEGGSKWGQRRGLEGSSLANPHVASAVLNKGGVEGDHRSRANRLAECSSHRSLRQKFVCAVQVQWTWLGNLTVSPTAAFLWKHIARLDRDPKY